MKRKVPEMHYRSSRICRVLGNPTAYQILKSIMEDGKTPSFIAEELQLSLPTVSISLRHLREIDLVRYENMREGKVYFVKDKTITSILDLLEKLVENIKTHEY